MAKPAKDRSVHYTYEDYLTWDGPERWELVDGVPYMMASPTPVHQQIALQLATEFGLYLRGKECQAFIAPMDLCFEESMKTPHVVQPDLFVMCGEYGRERRIVGIPVLVVEILSPSTAANDTIRKLNLYQRMNVREYWIVEPDENIINVYLHDGSTLRWTAECKPGDTLSPTMFADLLIDVSTIFA
ncbi:Uma2 family endonuclease [Alicyclobacillus shizuokensis]|uniref:Uma2 family endonuclease n=1 Tax=Alicyclobacillus shizuokensis TaxID=392014 RepID=UPI00082E10AD|nr:Uma2 family endonuclease [Alicyclobacillus shizuokensis]MCL6627366.1 Uma2 family endonuclease [Alicyclobacillus shizuokensis]